MRGDVSLGRFQTIGEIHDRYTLRNLFILIYLFFYDFHNIKQCSLHAHVGEWSTGDHRFDPTNDPNGTGVGHQRLPRSLL